VKKTIIYCDICGKGIEKGDTRFRFKRYRETYANQKEPEFTKWSKLDICTDCYRKFRTYVNARSEQK
jgi:ribosome-binding protein aMBF1 (putative translation factor)